MLRERESWRHPAWRTAWRLLTPADRILIVIVFLGAAASLIWSGSGTAAGGWVRVEVAGEFYGEYPLTETRVVDLDGPTGRTVMEIHDRAVRITAAPCLNQCCRRRGAVNQAGQLIVCVPNRVLISVAGGAPAAVVDAVAR